MTFEAIKIRGARQNNLKNLDLDIPLGEMVVVTGVSGSGKSTLAFDTIYAEGQRRYVETFSAYARQFLDRMDKPAVDSIDGIPPAIAIEQSNTVRTSRSTVGTMTELNDYLKLLFARLAHLFCQSCGREVVMDTPQSVVEALYRDWPENQRLMVCLPINVPEKLSDEEVLQLLNQQGYSRMHCREGNRVEVVQDRLKLTDDNRSRLMEAVEVALRYGKGHVLVYPLDDTMEAGTPARFSSHHHCPTCDISYPEPSASLFSFNSPIGACESCRGFGRTIGVDWGLVVPDESKSLKGGAIKPIQTPSYADVQRDLLKFAKKSGIPTDVAWAELTDEQRDWVLEGEGSWDQGVWYGIREFFDWLESKAYKMHIRVLLSKYRAYTPCQTCGGARLKPEALWWRVGSYEAAEQALADRPRFRPVGASLSEQRFDQLPGLNIHDVMRLPLARCAEFFERVGSGERAAESGSTDASAIDEATQLLLTEIQARLSYLCEVGLDYLTLDRQSRTLSGGEVQRINLTTALGTSLVNTLFVLDEPSTGLHPRDIQRLVKVLQRLRDAGNSLLVVEHDPQVILAADRILDIGPGPGRNGGNIQFFGTPKALLKRKDNVTARYLTGSQQVSAATPALAVAEASPKFITAPAQEAQSLKIWGASEHNLKNVDVEIPLKRLVCLTGVSGSGKSTLMRQVLYPALLKHHGEQTEAPGAHDRIEGLEHIDRVVMVDQSPIGKTTRSTPATYVGAFDAIRKLFVAAPLSKERDYKPGTFSFNSGNGRCPTCQGNGFEHVEMQFLSDVYLRCPDCDGRRFRNEILEVKLLREADGGAPKAVSIADVLEMTVAEALAFFHDKPEVQRSLQPLADVGLDYVQLGQAVPTLSGGEAQRLKLAGHLAATASKGKAKDNEHILFLFDEPTTGLHFADIATLMGAFGQLLATGHSLLVIEHNLDVIRAADWLIDIGPEGGDAGGQVLAEGTPAQVMSEHDTYTAQALREYEDSLSKGAPLPAASKQRPAKAERVISVHHAREHNLKNIDVTIPRDKLTVISGVSGSGKSTLAFDLIFGEGQRRYLESLNAYARQFVQPASRPDVDAIYGIPPAVAIEQRTSRGGRKSTVATLTEIYHYLRLLYVKLGTQYCPGCQVPIEPQTPAAILARVQKDYRDREVTLLAPMVVARKGIYRELAQWAAERGYSQLRVDGEYLPTDPWPQLDRYKEHDIELPLMTVAVSPQNERQLAEGLEQALSLGNGVVIVAPAGKEAGKKKRRAGAERLFSTERACPSCGSGFDELDPRLFSYNSKHGWCHSCCGTGVVISGFDAEQTGEESNWLPEEGEQGTEHVCPTCNGQRLNATALSVRFRDRSIAELAALPVDAAEQWFGKLKLKAPEQAIARDLLSEMHSRLHFLQKVGLNYLSLDRAAPTLSGGEAQRIRLAAQLGSSLQGVCYVLDEPTIGLHTRDNRKLIETLRELQQQGNTVVVVEHDEDTMREADHLIDMGPRAGVNGGEVVAYGSLTNVMRNKNSLTGQMLSNPLRHPLPELRNPDMRALWPEEKLCIEGASQNNLADVSVAVPLRQLVAITGVSGSGKSTLVRGVLYPNLKAAIASKRKKKHKWQGASDITGWENIDRILEVDQTPIGKTPRSCPATYIGIWDTIRKLFAGTVDARLRGYTPARFSFNAGDGRCEACGGQGMQKIEMNFLPDVRVPCEVCHGWRFNDETLSVRYKGKHIGDVLAMNIDEAAEFFEPITKVHHALCLLQDVGLGYLTLGQQSPTLSGGEAQRIKLVAELAKARMTPEDARGRVSQHNLYVLDEPTVGLHMADVEKLLRVLHRLVDAGNSVLVIEHNLDVVAEADWIIDMGPEGGSQGGKVIAQGTPATVIKRKRSHTGKYLAEVLG
jgi:excinuclease ABC subunit A